MAGYGRPLKGKSRRVPITVHSTIGVLDAIDDYVEERDSQEERAYSRSDFFNEAALLYLKQLGREVGGEELPADRTESVPKKSEAPEE